MRMRVLAREAPPVFYDVLNVSVRNLKAVSGAFTPADDTEAAQWVLYSVYTIVM